MGETYDLDRDGRGLTKREREFIGMKEEGLSMSEIAARLNLSRQRVYQIQDQIKRKAG